jgi:hypothetical protein
MAADRNYDAKVDAGQTRSVAKEREALSVVSQEYINSRGGINAQGYYMDVAPSAQLTGAEQRQVRNPDGSTDTVAMARILQEKQIKELVSTGVSLADATARVSGQYGEYGVPLIPGASGGSNASDSSKLGTTPTTDTKKVDQIAAISSLLSSYGLGDLTGAITEAVQKGYSNDTIQLIMQDPNSSDPLAVAFQMRFPANKARAAAGSSYEELALAL